MGTTILGVIACAEKGAIIDTETVIEATGMKPFRARSELKRLGLEQVTREEAISFIAKRSEEAVLRLADSYQQSVSANNRKDLSIDGLMLLLEKKELDITMLKAELKEARKEKPKPKEKKKAGFPNFPHTPVPVSELADWAGVPTEELVPQIMALSQEIHDAIELFPFPEDNPTVSSNGAKLLAVKLKLKEKDDE